MFRNVVLLLMALSLPSQAQQPVSYTARFTITNHTTGTPNPLQRSLDSSKEIIQAADGSKMQVKRDSGGRVIAGILWKDDKMYQLNYLRRQVMVFDGSGPRHPELPPDPPIGKAKVAGLDCVIYPLHIPDGKGTFCVDDVHGLTVKTEIQMRSGDGTQFFTEELTSIRFDTPPLLSIEIPKDFRVIQPFLAGKSPGDEW